MKTYSERGKNDVAADDTTQIEMSPDPKDKNINFVALTGCKYGKELCIQFYKINITPGHGKIEMVKRGQDILANNGNPYCAYLQKMYLTSLGFIFFQVEGLGSRSVRISVNLFSFRTEEIVTLK